MGEDEFIQFQMKYNAELLRLRIENALKLLDSKQHTAAFNQHTQSSRNAVNSSSSIPGRIITHGANVFKTSWRIGVNQAKIYGGLFVSDPNKNFGGRVWEVVSRFVWQGPQTMLGSSFATVSNLVGQVDKVDYWGGATVLSGNFWGQGGAVTLGSYITGSCDLSADPNKSLFQHEYGHYRQSQKQGPLYIFVVGIPSLYSAKVNNSVDHNKTRVEQNANKRGYEYLYRLYGDRLRWDHLHNQIFDEDWMKMIQNKYSPAP